MSEYQIKRIIKCLVDAQLLFKDGEHLAMAAIDEEFKNEISVFWTTDDVLSRAEDMGHPLDEEEALEVLLNVKRNHDASYGINWDSIESEIDCYMNNKEEEEEECQHANATLSDPEPPATYHCPDCGENFIGEDV